MAARAAKPVIEVKMAERGIEIVAPQEADNPAAEPDAFGIAGRSVQDVLGLGEFIDFLGLFGGVLARRGLLLGGLNLLAIGLLGEMQVRHYHEPRHRAPYSVDRVLRSQNEEHSVSE